MKLPNYWRNVSIDTKGESGLTYTGSFEIKCILSHQDLFDLEKMYQTLLPMGTTSEELKIKASVIAELSVRIKSGPLWWTESNQGRKLIDTEPLYDLMQAISKTVEEFKEELKASSEL